MEATILFINNVEFVGIEIFFLSLRSWNNSLADDHVSQSKPTIAQIVFSVMHREGSGGFSEGLCVCGMHSEEKGVASF